MAIKRAKKKAAKKKAAPKKAEPVSESRPLIPPDKSEPKSGCLYCSLFPFCDDYEGRVAENQKKPLPGEFQRDGAKILAKEKEGHKVRTRNVSEAEWTEVDILFVGEAPGALEDREGLPFVGKAGRRLKHSLFGYPKEGIPGVISKVARDRIGFTNVVRCQPPRNRDPNKTEMKCCGPELIREIRARKPKLLVALGNTPLKFLLDQSGITTFHGQIVEAVREEIAGMSVLCCFHPSYVDRMDHLTESFLDTLTLAEDFVLGKYKPKPGLGEYFTLTELEDVRELLRVFRDEKLVTACDLEAGSLSEFDEEFPGILSHHFTNCEGEGWSVPYDHVESPWCKGGPKEHERAELDEILCEFYADEEVPKIGHNWKFDRKHIRHRLGVEVKGEHADTMLMHLVIDETRGSHGLKDLAFVFTGMGHYDKPLEDYKADHKEADPRFGGSYANIPGDRLFPYGGMDVDATLRLYNELRQHPEWVKHEKLQRLALDLFPRLSATLSDMEHSGALIDPDVVDMLDKKYTAEMAEARKQIYSFDTVKQFTADMSEKRGEPDFEFNPRSPQQLQTLLFGYYKEKPVELTNTGFKRLVFRHKKLNDDLKAANELKFKERTVKPRPPQLSFSETVQRAVAAQEWGLFSTSADVLHELDRRGNELAQSILNYRGPATLHGTFVEPLKHRVDKWGRVHGNFNVHGTVTGRLSSNNPNLQNIPNKGGGLIKRAYISRFGDSGVILQTDYSQVELRIAACWYRDQAMIDAYKQGIDLHALTAADMHSLTLSGYYALPKSEQKEMRTRAKRINFGTIYGGGPPALQSTLKKDGVFVTLDECKAFLQKFFEVRPGLRKGIDKTEAFARKNGYLESFTGRRRRIPEVFASDEELVSRALRQAVNFPIQSGAGDMTLMSLTLVNEVFKAEGFASMPILTVHDSIVFDCHVDEVIDVACTVKEIMENIDSLSDEILPGLDWSWLDVPVIADCEVGYTWGQLVEFDPVRVRDEDVVAGDPLLGPDPDDPESGKIVQRREPKNVEELWTLMERKVAA